MPQSNGAFRLTYSWNRFMRLLLIAFVFVIFTSVLFFWFLPDRSEVSYLENQLRSQILRPSRDYVSFSSNKQSSLSDGPYTANNTAYDLKKTLSVLLNDMMQRMKVLETEVHSLKHANNVISSSPLQQSPLQRSYVWRNIQSVDFVALLQGVQENCIVEADRMLAYPECRSKMEWLRTIWKSDSCYANLGVDGTDCSIIRYLSEIEDYCPTIEQRRIMLQCPRANVNYDLDALLQLIPMDDSHQPSRQFIRDRLKRLWPQLVDGMREYSHWNEKGAPIFMNQPADYYDEKDRQIGQPLFHNRPKLRVNYDLDALLQLIPMDDSHQPSRQFIRDRLKRLWPQLVDGMREYAHWNEKGAPIFMNQPGDYPCHRRPVRTADYYDEKDRQIGQPLFHNRPKLRIHLHLGFISLTASKFFEHSVGR
ncbi:alpha-1,3(6)-mannosylglycoprotein beta-1,6-N-acetyl-glucosaminyltransferase, partial [Paragonimus westermani]